MSQLSYARYGKDNVRLYKVDKDPKTGIHTIVEQTVRILLEGDIETSYVLYQIPSVSYLTPSSYTKADNSVVVATDTQKQTTYILAKQHPIDPPEQFAAIIGDHFINTYLHIHAVHVKIIQHRWTRMNIDGKPHPHSFYRDGEETRVIESVTRENEGVSIRSKIEKLLVLKSTGSAFHGFHRDEYTKLPETWDRILSTEIEAGWQWKLFKNADEAKAVDFNAAWRAARDITMKTFAEDDSASVQATMYKMCDLILKAIPEVEAVDYALPNKHYFEIGMFIDELLGKDMG
jgi:urate oxidase